MEVRRRRRLRVSNSTGDQAFKLSEFPEDTARASTMEAKAYSLSFPDWKPASFDYWPANNGVV